ncbi:MAG TPA: ABC transporter permease [Tahibacter sp.]|uniref:ABC transporter permease n=1 Tax=Tahibacter sp. TaxID=2056211 RepID=UPI002B931039|nr:ABC transporter permease [Tahibacter sp.]HSX62567.1 ABC transporter permease [Tahibacter sp.]
MSTRWRKIWREFRFARDRFVLLVAALALAMTALTALLSARDTLTRSMQANFAATRAASAQLRVERLDAPVLAAVRAMPGVAGADLIAHASGRVVAANGRTRPLLLYIRGESLPEISTFDLRDGTWPPGGNGVLIERSARGVLGLDAGAEFDLLLDGERRATLRHAGVVHDAALAPASQEGVVYAYTSFSTAAALGIDAAPDWLLLRCSGAPTVAVIRDCATGVARQLVAQGHAVREVRIPPPGLHPHETQMQAALRLLLAFGVLAVVLAAVLCAAVVGGLLAQQSRAIAVQQSLGATPWMLALPYLALIAGLALVASAIGLFLGYGAGLHLALHSAQHLNLRIVARGLALAPSLLSLATGVALPVLAAAIPVFAAARRPVRAALDDHGIASPRDAQRTAFAARFAGAPALTLAWRNLWRRRVRLVLNLALLGAAGALFLANANLRSGWYAVMADAARQWNFQQRIALQEPVDSAAVRRALAGVPGLRAVESWPSTMVAADDGDALFVTGAHADGGHGAVRLRAVPDGSDFLALPITEGRWLATGDTHAIVLNSVAASTTFAGTRVGDWLDLRGPDGHLRAQVVGIAREVMAGASIYTTPGAYALAAPGDATAVSSLRLAYRDGRAGDAAIVRKTLEGAGIAVSAVIDNADVGESQWAHLGILLLVLRAVAVIMAVVGLAGLAAAASAAVIDRRREFGVLAAIGATPATILRSVLYEAVFAALLSLALALPLSLAATAAIAPLLDNLAGMPLPLRLSPAGSLLWAALLLPAAVLACLLPARSAAKLSVVEALRRDGL